LYMGHQDVKLAYSEPGRLKVGRMHKDKNNVISGFIRSLALNTSTLAPRDVHYSLLCADD